VLVAVYDDSPEGSVIGIRTRLAPFLALSAAAGDDDGVVDDADHYDDPGLQKRDDRGGRGPLVLLAYKERDPAERQLWEMTDDDAQDGHRARVCREASWRGRAVEIWLGVRRGRKGLPEPCCTNIQYHTLCLSLLFVSGSRT